MNALNPDTGRTPVAPVLSHQARLKAFLERLDRARRSQWRDLLALQAEQFARLAALIESKPLSSRGAGPDLSALAHHRHMREPIDQPLVVPAPVPHTPRRG